MESNLKIVLSKAITALEKDIVGYDWNKQQSCNCGVVIQAISGKLPHGVMENFRLATKEAGLTVGGAYTWKEICQASCSVTGEPLTLVFKELFQMGLTPKDIIHLEYLDNPAILKESGIRKRWDSNFFKKKKNLILYLKAWVRIIDKGTLRKGFSKKEELEANLLIATAFEKYEEASEIKKEILAL